MNAIPSSNPHSPFFVIGRQSGAAVMNLHTGEVIADNFETLADADKYAAEQKVWYEAQNSSGYAPLSEDEKRNAAQALGLLDRTQVELAALGTDKPLPTPPNLPSPRPVPPGRVFPASELASLVKADPYFAEAATA